MIYYLVYLPPPYYVPCFYSVPGGAGDCESPRALDEVVNRCRRQERRVVVCCVGCIQCSSCVLGGGRFPPFTLLVFAVNTINSYGIVSTCKDIPEDVNRVNSINQPRCCGRVNL